MCWGSACAVETYLEQNSERTCVRSAIWHAAYDKQLCREHPHLNNFGFHFVTWSFAAVWLSVCLSVCLSVRLSVRLRTVFRKCQFCLGTKLVFLGNVYRLRTVFRKREFGVGDRHVSVGRIHGACAGNVHRRRDRVCDPGELVRFFGNVSFASGLSMLSLEMCTGFERFFGNVSLA